MPTARRVTVRTLSREEQRFIERFVREGGTEDKIAVAERLAYLKVGSGVKFLRLVHVQDEIKRRMEPIRIEQSRQQMMAEAVAQVTAKIQSELESVKAELAARDAVPMMRVEESVLEHELMRLVTDKYIGTYPQVKLAAIQAAFVVKGILEQGNTKRTIPPEGGPATPGPGIYSSMRQRILAGEVGVPVDIQAAKIIPQEPEVFDLIPRDEAAYKPPVAVPEIGAEIEAITLEPEPAKRPKAKSGAREVITVVI